jgi:hypothetical protein
MLSLLNWEMSFWILQGLKFWSVLFFEPLLQIVKYGEGINNHSMNMNFWVKGGNYN